MLCKSRLFLTLTFRCFAGTGWGRYMAFRRGPAAVHDFSQEGDPSGAGRSHVSRVPAVLSCPGGHNHVSCVSEEDFHSSFFPRPCDELPSILTMNECSLLLDLFMMPLSSLIDGS